MDRNSSAKMVPKMEKDGELSKTKRSKDGHELLVYHPSVLPAMQLKYILNILWMVAKSCTS